MKKFLLLCLLSAFPFIVFSQSYLDWSSHEVVRFYEKIHLDSYTIDKDGEVLDEIYVPIMVEVGVYDIEVYKISSKLYRIEGTEIYMYFRFPPILMNYDKGVLEIYYNNYGTFYEDPY